MSKSTNSLKRSDFIIHGPTMVRENAVLEAIHALYYLPEQFKLVFSGPTPVDRIFYYEIVQLIERDELTDRVHFTDQPHIANATIADITKTRRQKDSIKGDSPEAIASAILAAARQ